MPSILSLMDTVIRKIECPSGHFLCRFYAPQRFFYGLFYGKTRILGWSQKEEGEDNAGYRDDSNRSRTFGHYVGFGSLFGTPLGQGRAPS